MNCAFCIVRPMMFCHVEESAAVVSERFVHYLVGGIYYARHVAAFALSIRMQVPEQRNFSMSGSKNSRGLLE